ncbi:Rv3654c family TadE-like protein [Calidifontibacter terrae]
MRGLWARRWPLTGGRPRSAVGTQRGSATVLMTGVVAVALILFAALITIAAAQLASARARAAADFAALAAAGADLRPDGGAPCAAAADLAGRNGARLVRCTALGGSRFEVVVAVRPRLVSGVGLGDAVARSRAGPGAVVGGPAPAQTTLSVVRREPSRVLGGQRQRREVGRGLARTQARLSVVSRRVISWGRGTHSAGSPRWPILLSCG